MESEPDGVACLEGQEEEINPISGMDVDMDTIDVNDKHCDDLDITVELSSSIGNGGSDSQLTTTTIGSMTSASQQEVEDGQRELPAETDKPMEEDGGGGVDVEGEVEPEDDRPTISIRNFAEIAENDDEDDDDADDVVFLDHVDMNRHEISAEDLEKMSLDLTVEEEMHEFDSLYRVPKHDELRIEFIKLRKALIERIKNRENEATRPRPMVFTPVQPLIRMTPSVPSPPRYQMARAPVRPPGPSATRAQFPAPRMGMIVRQRGPVPIRPSPASSSPRNGAIIGRPPVPAGASQSQVAQPSNSSGGGGGAPLSPSTISFIATDGSNSNNILTLPLSQYQLLQAPTSAPYSTRPGSQMQTSRQLIPATYGRLTQGQTQNPNGNLRFASQPQSQIRMGNQQIIRLPSGIQITQVSSSTSNNNSRAPNPERVTQPQFKPQLNPTPRFQSKQYPHPPPPPVQRHPVAARTQPPSPPPPHPRSLGKENVGFQQQNQSQPQEIITAGTQRPIPGTIDEAEDLNSEGGDKKTFPSLIVQVKPCLTVKPGPQSLAKSRRILDSNVKETLMAIPSKFTEWLMRRGLLKVEQRCILYPQVGHVQSMKLGIYSDSTKEPFSGGYVWAPDCCPEKQVSVFKGSLFEGSKYPPGTLLKLIYHWACQTPVENVVQWVKVPSLFLKNFYTMLRAVCILWLHEICPQLGGEKKYVEIGVITLGGSSETQKGRKSVKVEILGVFDPATKMVRLKVINVLHGVKNKGGTAKLEEEQGARAFQILWALAHWVDRRSTLLVDEIVDKTLFLEMGFNNVIQCPQKEQRQGVPTNANVMNYLRHFVPKIFSNTLTVLSKSIIQQFLDELCWRERHGHNSLLTYNSIIDHIVEITKWDSKDGMSLISRLSKVRENPFVDCSVTKQTRRSPLNTIPITLRVKPGIRECINYIMKTKVDNAISSPSRVNQPPPLPPNLPIKATAGAASTTSTTGGQKRKLPQPQTVGEIVTLDVDLDKKNYEAQLRYYNGAPKLLNLDRYYYGRTEAQGAKHWSLGRLPFLKCPLCAKSFGLSNRDLIRHLGAHVTSISRKFEFSICQYCLVYSNSVKEHQEDMHYFLKSPYVCMLCELQFKTEMELTMHMWELHVEAEAPYACEVCDFSSSFHTEVVDHFGEAHGDIGYVMCPHCLKVLVAKSNANLQSIVVHLQTHQLKRCKKCPKCVLSFGNEDDLQLHLMSSHSTKTGLGGKWLPYSQMLPFRQLHPLVTMAPPPARPSISRNKKLATNSNTGIPFPPKKRRKLSETRKNSKVATPPPPPPQPIASLNAPLSLPIPVKINEKYGGSKYTICVPKLESGKALCFECGIDISIPNHFIGRLRCTKCVYTTACEAAMNRHHELKHGEESTFKSGGVLKAKKLEVLSSPLVCQCGFVSKNPNLLAEHLGHCGKYTVFPIPTEIGPNGVEKSCENEAVLGIEVVMADEDETRSSTTVSVEPDFQEDFIASPSRSATRSPKCCEVQE